MALIPEDGSIVAGSDTYIDVASADTYHSNYGNTAWALATTTAKEAALRNACRYIDGHYRTRWLGFRVRPVGSDILPVQQLEWPRLYVPVLGAAPGIAIGHAYANYLPSNRIPQRLKEAQCEAALIALSAALAPVLDPSVESEKLDVIETRFKSNGKKGAIEYQHIDQLISDYLTPIGCSTVIRG